MLELHLEKADHLDCQTGRTGNGHGREHVGGKDLADLTMGHLIPLGGLAVAHHHHSLLVAEGENRGPFRGPQLVRLFWQLQRSCVTEGL